MAQATANHYQHPFNLATVPAVALLLAKEKEPLKLYGALHRICEMLGAFDGEIALSDDQYECFELSIGEDYKLIFERLIKRKVIVIKDDKLTSPIYDLMMEKYEATRERCRQGGIASAQARAEKAAKKAEKEPKKESPKSEKNVEYCSRPAVILD